MAGLRRIELEAVRVGMTIYGLSRTETTTPEEAIEQGQLIMNAQTPLDLLAEGHRYAFLTVQPPEVESPEGSASNDKTSDRSSGNDTFNSELLKARSLKGEAVDAISRCLTELRAGRILDTSAVTAVVKKMLGSVLRDPCALLCLARFKDYDNYTAVHSVNVSIFALALGNYIGLEKEQLYRLGLGAMLHDIGKMQIPEKILFKNGPLSKEELEEVKKHPTQGVKLLSSINGLDKEVSRIVHEHHEKQNGTGYPEGLSDNEIHHYAKITGVCDAYDAMTSNRAYHDSTIPNSVLKEIFALKGRTYDDDTVEQFIRCLGIYPVGSLVELSNGEVAVVKSIDHANLLSPTVVVVFDRKMMRQLNPFEIDFSKEIGIHITAPVEPTAIDLKFSTMDLDQYISF